MRILGIDYGEVRTGVAVSDPMGWTATGIETIHSGGSRKKVVRRICELVSEYGVERIVVGFPRNMNGTVGERGLKTQEFIDALADYIGKAFPDRSVSIIKWDERLTTVEAGRIMREVGAKASQRKKIVDQLAAEFILQSYLDSIKTEL